MTLPEQADILIVDDVPDNIRLLVNLLQVRGYRIRTAVNGRRALATIERQPPDLILLDIMMPEMSGFEVCGRLKADPRFATIPVIFISALNEVFDKVTAFSVGGVDYITKPFQAEEVLARVDTHLTIQAMRRQLQSQNEELQAQNAELEAFARTVAHDLKNPLSTTLGFVELLRMQAPGLDEQLIRYIDKSAGSIRQMNNIIDELLTLSSIRKESVQLAPLNMERIAERAFERVQNLMTMYEPEIYWPEEWLPALGYAAWIEEILVNYISNAMKYGGRPPQIELASVALPNGWVRFEVRDNGAGLDEADRENLFEEFTRLEPARAQGHGLGLSIVRRIIDKLGGGYGVDSEPGVGSTFYFVLPALDE